jgi:MFS family permease
MFSVVNMSTNMMQTYMVVSLEQLFGLPHAVGNTGLTVFLGALVAGIIIGGFIADRVKSQSLVAAAGFGLSALLIVLVGTLDIGSVATVALIGMAGLLAGIIMPSRDLLVRKASPPDAVGRVFGIVTTGFNFGGMVAPIIGGVLVDHHLPAWIFYGSAIFMLVTVVIAIAVEKNARFGMKI